MQAGPDVIQAFRAHAADILVGLAVYCIFGFASDAVLRIVERRVLSWRRTLAS